MDQREKATQVVRVLRQAGYLALFAGGWVRDYLLGEDSPDIDIATDAPPEDVIRLFPHTVEVGASFGVVMVILEDTPFEVATFRKDGLYLYGRRPETVEYSSPPEDAQRRDFTINGMFYDPIRETILDFVGGQKDLREGIVRAIGTPQERFQEDRLRMIRGVRLSARFGFEIEETTESAIRELAHTLLPAVAMERVWQELQKMTAHPGMADGLLRLYQLGLLSEVFPELRIVEPTTVHSRIDVSRRFPADTPTALYLHQLFEGDDFESHQMRMRRLRASNEAIKWIQAYLSARRLFADGTDNILAWVELYADSRYPLLRDVYCAGEEGFRESFLAFHALQRERLHSAIQRKQRRTPIISSARLKEEGIPPGRQMGLLLEEAERIAIEHETEDIDTIMARLKQSCHWG